MLNIEKQKIVLKLISQFFYYFVLFSCVSLQQRQICLRRLILLLKNAMVSVKYQSPRTSCPRE